VRGYIKAYLKDLESEEVRHNELSAEILKKVVAVLQKHLKLDVSMFYSRDRDEIFVKIRSSEENLKKQANLVGYRMKLKNECEHKEAFMEFAPHCTFDEDKESCF
jgi:hypothetical protein